MKWAKDSEGGSFLSCKIKVMEEMKPCQNTSCKMHINFPKELNCAFVSIDINDALKPHEIYERTGVRMSCQSKALSKFRKKFTILHQN